jgi:hypothetical protein
MKKMTQFDIFKAECLRQIERLGLKDWNIVITDKEKISNDEDAEVNSNTKGRAALIKWNPKNNPKYSCPVHAARHEIAHILLLPLSDVASRRWSTKRELAVEEERAATILEKVL